MSIEGAADLSLCRYVDFPGVGTIDLDTPELPGNDRKMLEVATEQMFADPSILNTIASVAVLRQDEGAGGSTPPPHRRRQRCSRGVLDRHGVGRDHAPANINRGGHGRVPAPAH
jgi:hypothetical protein